MKKDIVGFTFAFLVLAFTATAGYSWDRGPWGNNYRRNDTVGGAVRHLVHEVQEAVGLRPNHGGWNNGGWNHHHHHSYRQQGGFYRQPAYVIQTRPVVVPVRQVYPVRQQRRFGNSW